MVHRAPYLIPPCLPSGVRNLPYYGSVGMMRFGAAGPLHMPHKGEDVILPRSSSDGKTPAQNFVDAILGRAEIQTAPTCGFRVAQITESAYK